MSKDIPSDLKYTEEHEWVKINDDGTVIVGITHHAAAQLGDVVYVELPELDGEYEKNDEAGTVESVKAVAEVYMPIKGQIIALNTQLEDEPSLVNDEPYDQGWFFKIKPDNMEQLDQLLTADQYQALTED